MLEIAICDDDLNDLTYAMVLIQEVFEHNKISYNLQLFNSGSEMLLKVKQLNIALLDISMKELNGVDLGRALKIRFPELKLIYVTSFEQYCIQAVNCAHAFSYLCKPLNKERLQEQLLDLMNECRYFDYLKEKTFYQVLDDNKQQLPMVTLKLKDIIYFEYIKSMRKISIVLEGQSYKCPYVMDQLAEELAHYGFFTNCRGQLVNFRHIYKIKGYEIHLYNGQVLTLSQKRAVGFKKSMNEFLHNNI